MIDAAELCRGMTLKQRVGQCLMPAMGGQYSATGERVYELAQYFAVRHEVGGFCMFDGSIFETPLMLNALQDLGPQPLLVAADLEAGAGRHLSGATEFPSAMAVGATGPLAAGHAARMGRITAREARACGVHLIFAPVVDCNLTPANPIVNTRAFGDDPERVGACAAAFVRGCAEGGAEATLKHFPGHGTTVADSHAMLPRLDFDRVRWDREEGRAFRIALEAHPAAVMMGHLLWPALDAEWPCSLSPAVVTGLLRRELGFEGLICTDAMMMGALADRGDEAALAVQALRAGVDLLLYPRNGDRVVEGILAALESGALAEEVVTGAATRVLALKGRMGLVSDRRVDLLDIESRAGTEEHRAAAAAVARDAWTVVRDDGALGRLRADRSGTTVWCVMDDAQASPGEEFVRGLRDRMPACEVERVTAADVADRAAELTSRVLPPDRLIVGFFGRVRAWKGRAGLDPALRGPLNDVAKRVRDAMGISFGSPYLARECSAFPTFALAWSEDPASQANAAAALFDPAPARGTCPVRLG